MSLLYKNASYTYVTDKKNDAPNVLCYIVPREIYIDKQTKLIMIDRLSLCINWFIPQTNLINYHLSVSCLD